jgi:peptidoglycan/xylan/chitin deacetylase (PgdA/CDA1 family)
VAAAAVGVVHALPALGGIGSLRRSLLPRLAGVGRADHVALTFDDGPQPGATPAFLAALDRLGWRATFFMLGEMVRADPGLAAEVAGAGHEVAVHGDRHRSSLLLGPRAIGDDLRRGVDAVSEATGQTPVWFRPAYGTLSAGGLGAARALGLRTVLWTTWGRDWRPDATPATVVADVRRHLGPGGTVLLHDSDCTSSAGAWRSALGALPALAEVFAAAGLAVGPLAEHGVAGAGRSLRASRRA